MVGAAGLLIIFFAVFIATILVSLFVLSYATHCFLVVLVHTAAGDDAIKWPDDSLYDWFLRVWQFIWLLAVWFVPAFFIMKLMAAPPLAFVAGTVAILWLVFPVTVLSSLSALSGWVIFRPVILRALFKHLGTLLGFYFITGILLALCTGLFYASVLTDYAILLPVAAAMGAIGFFIYARLLGRIGLIISFYKPAKRSKAKAEDDADRVQIFDPWGLPEEEQKPTQDAPAAPRPPGELARPRKKKRKRQNDSAYDPWGVPAEQSHAIPSASDSEDPLGPVTGTYGLAAADAPAPVKPRAELPDAGLESYAVAEPDAKPITPVQPLGSPQVAKYELELAIRRRPPPPPARPLTTGVYNFPFYQECLMPVAALTLGFLGIAALLRLLLSLFAQIPSG
jgi:hypothetical protein